MSVEEVLGYADEAAWGKYFEEWRKLYDLAQRILAVHRRLSLDAQKRGRELEALLENYEYLKALLGGYRLDKCGFEEKALGAFYKDIFGFYVRDDGRLCALVKSVGPEKAVAELGVNTSETDTIKAVTAIYVELLNVPSLTGAADETEFNAERGPELIREFLNTAMGLLPLYNKLSFFIQSLGCGVPRFYFEKAYPSLAANKKLLEKHGVVLETRYTPNVPDEELKRGLAVVGLKEGSAGLHIYNAIQRIYDLFDLYELKKYFGIESQREKYCKTYEHIIKGVIQQRGITLTSLTGYIDNVAKDLKWSYQEVFNTLAPLMFIGILCVDKNGFVWRRFLLC